MLNLRIVTDSDCDLPRTLLDQYHIPSFPMAIHFGPRRYWDGVDLDAAAFYARLNGLDHPRTDHPDPGEMRRIYLELARDGSPILSIHVSHKLSETAVIARRLAEELRGQADIVVVDTLAASLGQGLLVWRAAMLAESGMGREQIIPIIQNLIPQVGSVLSINSLDFLAKGGRLSRAAMMVGTVAGLKPIISLNEEGMLALVARAYGWERALKHIQQWVADRITFPEENWLGVLHSRLPGEAEGLAETLRKRYSPQGVLVAEIGPSIGTHIGPGALGVTFFSEKGRA